MFQCRMYNLAFDKAWAQCCQPPSVTGMHLVLFCKEKGVFFDHKLAQAFRNWCRWWLDFVRLFKKWFESTAFNLSIWTWMGFDTRPPPLLDVGGRISHAGHFSVSLAAMGTAIFPILKLPHSSSYTPQNLLKAGGKGRLIKKSLISLQAAPVWGRREKFWGCSLHPSPARMLEHGRSTAWHEGNKSIKQTDWPWDDSKIILSDLYLWKNKHTTFKKEKNKKSLQSWAWHSSVEAQYWRTKDASQNGNAPCPSADAGINTIQSIPD